MPVYSYRTSKHGVLWFYKTRVGHRQFLRRGFLDKVSAMNAECVLLMRFRKTVYYPRFSMLVASFLDNYSKSYKFSSGRILEGVFRNHVLGFFPDVAVNELSYGDFEKWWQGIVDDGSVKDKNYYRSYMIRLFDFALDFYGFDCRFAKQLPLWHDYSPAESVRSKRVLSLDEFRKIYDSVSSDDVEFRLVLLLSFFCGLRIGELRGLLVSAFDFSKGVMNVVQQVQYFKGRNVLSSAKSRNSVRSYVLPGFLLDRIRFFVQRRDGSLAGDDFVFRSSRRNCPVSPHWVYLRLAAAIKKSGVASFRFHDFRRTDATLLNEAGINQEWISAYLGHGSTEVTKKYYIGQSAEHEALISKVLDDKFRKEFS